MPGRVTAKHHVDVRNPHIYFCEKCKMIDLMDGQKLCGQRKLEEVRNNRFHVFFILQKFAFFHVAKVCVARVSLLPGRATQIVWPCLVVCASCVPRVWSCVPRVCALGEMKGVTI